MNWNPKAFLERTTTQVVLLFVVFLVAAGSDVQSQVVPKVPQSDTALSGKSYDTSVFTPLVQEGKRADGDTIKVETTITTGDVSYLSVCPGSTVMVPFITSGSFRSDNVFVVQLIDATGNAVDISNPTALPGAIKAVIPANKKGGHLYRIRVVSSSPSIRGREVPIRIISSPVARLETADGSHSSRIMPGQQAHLRVTLTGGGPWSFQLSDGTTVRETISNPYYFSVKPEQITTYKLSGVANSCGSGQADGSVVVNVDANPEPRLALKDAEKGFKVCSGIPFQVPFNATGRYKTGNSFVVQLIDSNGDFRTISVPDTITPLMAQVPLGTKPGDYKLRVLASGPHLSSDTARIQIAAPTHTVLQGDSLSIKEGETAELALRFQGGGPWFVLLSDGTYENNILASPFYLKVNPANSTSYQIASSGGLCGVGTFSGKARVFVRVPPSTIVMDKPGQSTVCAGGEVDIPFKTTGRFNAANKFIVQVADANGNFVNLPTTGKESPLKAKVTPTFQRDTISVHRIRIVSTSPAAVSDVQEIKVVASDMAIGEVSGKGVIAPGGSTRIRLKFKNGLPPWSFSLSDGTTINGTFLNPYLITVSPKATTEFTISSLKSACGNGTSMGGAIITVDK